MVGVGTIGIMGFGLVVLAIEVGGIFAIVYFAARLAIRHERRNAG
jgi:hypothetical protein